MRVAAYCRVSTDKEDQLNSLQAQKAFFEEFARKNGHTLVDIYADEGISGTKTKNRRAFLRLLQDAKTGAFDLVAVKDISRFARNTVDLLQSTRALKAMGIDTFFLTSSQTVLGNSEFVLTVFGRWPRRKVRTPPSVSSSVSGSTRRKDGYRTWFTATTRKTGSILIWQSTRPRPRWYGAFSLCTPRKGTAREELRLCSTPRGPAPSGAAPSAKRPCPGF